jgi:hypothetical protein
MEIAVADRRARPSGGEKAELPPGPRPASSLPTSTSSLRGLPLEWKVLLGCARPQLDADSADAIRGALQEGIDWNRLYRLASRHRLVPFVYRHLHALDPDAVPASFRLQFLANARFALQRAGELLELVHAFEAADILAVPYKGPALSAQLYGDATLRTSRDLDVLVRRGDAVRAQALLIGRGYRPETPQGEAEEAFRRRSRYSETFLKDGSFRVELHWAFTNQDVGFPLELDALSPRLGRIALGGGEVPTFAAEDLLLILCVHGAKHRWSRLEWITGVAELIRRSSIDWTDAVARARELGSLRMLLLGSLLAHELFDAPLPGEVLRQIRSDRSLSGLVSEVFEVLVDDTAEFGQGEDLATDIFRFRMRERAGERIRFALYRLTTPSNPAEWRVVSIGRWSFPFHALVRPIRLIGKVAAMPWAVRSRLRSLRRSD